MKHRLWRMAFITAALGLWMGAFLPLGSAVSGPETIELEFREGTDMEAVPSPDGRYLALQLWQQIWVLEATGGKARLLTDATSPPDEHWFPRWSPDGSSIAFCSLRTDGGLFVVSASGGKPRRLTDREFDFWPSWSPDGRMIVFARFLGGQGLWTVPAAGGNPRRITPEKLDANNPAWSPDGEWIAFTSAGHLSVMKPDGSSVRQVTSGTDNQGPSWSPDGRHLFFISRQSGLPQVWSVPIEGGEPRKLTDESDLYLYAPQWMPGRNVLVYTAGGKIRTLDPKSGAQGSIPFHARLTLQRQSYQQEPPQIPEPGAQVPVHGVFQPVPSPDGQSIIFTALGDLWLRHAEGRVEQLTSGPEDDVDPAWSPDGRSICFVSNRGGDYQVWVLNLVDRTKRQVTSTPGNAERPVWHPSGESIVFAQGPRPQWGDTLSVVPAAGGTPRAIIQTTGMDVRPLGWLPGDQSLVFSELYYDVKANEIKGRIQRVRMDGSSLSTAADPPGQFEFATLSPKADRLTYVSQGELWTRPLAVGAVDQRLALGPAFFPAWSSSGHILFVRAGKLMSVDARTGEEQQLPLDLSYKVPRSGSLFLRNARLLTPEPREGLWDLLLEGGRIQTIDLAGKPPGKADRVLDLEGRTVIPGLLALHEHMFRGFPAEGYLYWGVTSVAGAGEEGHWAVSQQEAIRSGRRAGPRMFPAAGFVVNTWMNAFPQFLRVKTAEHLERYLDHLKGLGATQVKAYLRRDPWAEAAAISSAHRRGLPVLSHFLRPASVGAGLDRKEHAFYYTWDGAATARYQQDIIEIMRRGRVTLDPTLVWAFAQSQAGRTRWKEALARTEVSSFLVPSDLDFVRRQVEKPAPPEMEFERTLQAGMANVRSARTADIRIVVGTDYPLLHGLGVHWELELLVAAGLSPLEALRAATGNAAATLGLEGRLGSIAPGAMADLMVLEADPLKDIRNTQKIYTVIQDGEIIDRGALLASRQE